MRYVFKTDYRQDLTLSRHPGDLFWYGLLLAVTLVIPFFLGEFYVGELGGVYIFAIAGVGLMLSGHTHAGQVCLPGGVPVITNAACPRRMCRGAWRFGHMLGYTSAGTGSSGLDARLNCPPEAVLHRLSMAPDSRQ